MPFPSPTATPARMKRPIPTRGRPAHAAQRPSMSEPEKGMGGWPLATSAFYRPNASCTMKVEVENPSPRMGNRARCANAIRPPQRGEEAGDFLGDVGSYGGSQCEMGSHVRRLLRKHCYGANGVPIRQGAFWPGRGRLTRKPVQ